MSGTRVVITILGLAAAVPLAAQDPHIGVGLSLSIPTGAFNSTNYPPSGNVTSASNEGYNTTIGGQFTVSFPVSQSTALRLDIYGQSTDGQDTAPGYATYNLEHDLLSLGGEVQFFPGTGDAYRHRGCYLLAGASVDLERFQSSYYDPTWYGYSVNKTRLGGIVGVGYTFMPWGRLKNNVELAFHKTLSGYSTDIQPTVANPATPPADFIRATYGIIF